VTSDRAFPCHQMTSEAPSTPVLTVRLSGPGVEAETLLPLPVLTRLCGDGRPFRARQDTIYRSRLVVAFEDDVPVGFAAVKPTLGPVGVVHELWVHPRAVRGLTAVTHVLVRALESVARRSGWSRLFIVLVASSPLRPILERATYRVMMSSADVVWLEKECAANPPPRSA